MVSFNETLRAIAKINSRLEGNNSSSWSKWHIHQERAAKMLNISETDDTSGAAIVGGFVDCLKNGGSGSRKADTFVPNPPPYDKTKIDVFDSSPNALNFHATKYRKNQNSPCMGNTPSPDAVIRDAVYYCFGGEKTKVSLKRQLELIRYVTGSDGHLHRHFDQIAAERQKLWLLWATDDPAGAAFHNVEHHLPVIALWFRDLWDIKIDGDVELKDITQTQLSTVKREIIDALVASFVLEPSAVGICPPTRRSTRIRGNVEGADDVEISAIPDKENKRKRHEANQSDPLVDTVSDSDDDHQGCDEHDGTFDVDASLTRLRELPLERVGVLEVAYNCAHSKVDYPTITRRLLDLDQDPISEEEYKCIAQISKQRLSRVKNNFTRFKADINKHQLLKVKDEQLLLDYLRTIAQVNNGIKLPTKLCFSLMSNRLLRKKIEDDISSPSRVEELKDSSTEEYLLEFVKVNKSAHLLTVVSDQANKMKAIHTLMKEFADKETEHQYERDFERPDYLVKTTSYCEGDFMYCSDDEEDDD